MQAAIRLLKAGDAYANLVAERDADLSHPRLISGVPARSLVMVWPWAIGSDVQSTRSAIAGARTFLLTSIDTSLTQNAYYLPR